MNKPDEPTRDLPPLDEMLVSAHEAASADQGPARVAELEAMLATERAESARRLRDVEGHMRVMRGVVQELQAEFRRAASERELLVMEVEKRDRSIADLRARLTEARANARHAVVEREGATADVVTSAVTRAQTAEAELAEARREIERLAHMARSGHNPDDSADHLSADTGRLEAKFERSEDELIRATEALEDVERRLRQSQERAAAMRQAVEDGDASSDSGTEVATTDVDDLD